ncbi:Mu-like prophage major head subunit gpT family protein [Snodgrassella alvi]|uniref:Mu-like prophage major head subunit gpT family protein n=1 Tax=Snodgrassella alvi TaxID=1196083 RepID=UPI003D039A36
MATVTSTLLNALTISLRKEFQEGIAHAAPTWSEIAMRIPSTTGINVYSWLGEVPMMEEWLGKRVVKQLKENPYHIENKLFTSTVGVPRTAIEDDQVGNYRLVVKHMGEAAAKLPDQLVWGLLPKGLDIKCFDGQSYFDAEHPLYANSDGTGDVSFQSNVTTGQDTGVPKWYVIDDSQILKALVWQERTAPELESHTDSAKSDNVFMYDKYYYGARARGNAGFGLWQLAHAAVDCDLNAENLDKILSRMKTLKADGGHNLAVRPTKLIVPPELETPAKKLLKTQIIDGTTNIWADCLKLHVEPNLS